jgi:hypothetical protein
MSRPIAEARAGGLVARLPHNDLVDLECGQHDVHD